MRKECSVASCEKSDLGFDPMEKRKASQTGREVDDFVVKLQGTDKAIEICDMHIPLRKITKSTGPLRSIAFSHPQILH